MKLNANIWVPWALVSCFYLILVLLISQELKLIKC